jgi:hypothetical protein
MSNWDDEALKETFDVLRVIWYNENINVTLRKNVSHLPQLQPLKALRKRGKLMLKEQPSYRELGPEHVEEKAAEATTRWALRRLEQLGYQVTLQPSEVA